MVDLKKKIYLVKFMGPNEWENLVKFMGPNEWENPQKQWTFGTLANPNGRILIENLEMYLPT